MSVAAPRATDTSTRSDQVTLLAAWALVLLASGLPQVVGRELLGRPVTADQRALLALVVIGSGWLVTVIWRPVRSLRPLLVVLGVLVGAQWVVYTRVDQLGGYPAWLADSSFNVSMLAEQSLNLIVALVMIATLLALGRHPPGVLPHPRRPRPPRWHRSAGWAWDRANGGTASGSGSPCASPVGRWRSW